MSSPAPPPPLQALRDLAKAHILLHLCAHLTAEMEFGAIAACAIMLYGIEAWKVAERAVRMEMIDDEERGESLESDDAGQQGPNEGGEEQAAVEARELVLRAINAIHAWDREYARRIVFALEGVFRPVDQRRGEGWGCLIS